MSDSRDDFIIAIRYALLRKGAKQKFSLFFLILLSISIITLEWISLPVMTPIRAVLNDVVYKVSVASSSPEKFINYLGRATKQHYSTLEQNKILQEEIIKLKNNQFTSAFLKTENETLKNALSLNVVRSLEGEFYVYSRVILDQESPYLKSLLINKGRSSGIVKGMTVFSKNYLIGTIIESNYLTSRVLLVTDLNSKIPVMIQDSDVHGILSGKGGKNNLILDYVPDLFQLEPDKIIFTSGKDGFLSPGIPVAQSFLNKKNEVRIRVLADPDQALIIYVTKGQFNR